MFSIRQSDGIRSIYKVALLHQHGGGYLYRIELQSSMKCFVTSVLTEIDL